MKGPGRHRSKTYIQVTDVAMTNVGYRFYYLFIVSLQLL
jgi:hypothetical protein